MMSKFLLFLCFAVVHVLGEGQEIVLPKTKDTFPINKEVINNEKRIEPLKNDEESIKLSTVSSKITSAPALPLPAETNKSKAKPEEVSSTQRPTQSTAVNLDQSTVASINATAAPVSTNKPSTEQILHTTIKPTITNASIIPKAVASHTAGKWIVNGTNEICIIVQMSVTFNVSYINANNMTSFKAFDLPTNNGTVNATGACGKMEQSLTLEWTSENVTNASMTLHFTKNETEKHYSFHHLEVVLAAANFPNITTNKSMVLVHNAESNYIVGLSDSYRCLKQQKLNLKEENTNHTSGYLTVSNLQFQAFKSDNSTVFGLAKDCAFDTPDVVPIVVGCVLAGLVIIVLIAYLIGRRRSQAQGYLSM